MTSLARSSLSSVSSIRKQFLAPSWGGCSGSPGQTARPASVILINSVLSQIIPKNFLPQNSPYSPNILRQVTLPASCSCSVTYSANSRLVAIIMPHPLFYRYSTKENTTSVCHVYFMCPNAFFEYFLRTAPIRTEALPAPEALRLLQKKQSIRQCRFYL